MYELTKLESFANGFVMVIGVVLLRCDCWKNEDDDDVAPLLIPSVVPLGEILPLLPVPF